MSQIVYYIKEIIEIDHIFGILNNCKSYIQRWITMQLVIRKYWTKSTRISAGGRKTPPYFKCCRTMSLLSMTSDKIG